MVRMTDGDGSCLFVNRRWCEFTGQTSEAGSGWGWTKAIHPGDRAFVAEKIRGAQEKQEFCRTEYRLRNKAGDYRWVIDLVAPRFGTEGEFLGFVGTMIDVENGGAFQDRLRESEERGRVFFEASGVGAAQVGPDKFFQRVNRCFCEITGYSEEELLQMTPLDLDHPEEREADEARIQRVIDDPDLTYDVEKRYVRKDGRVIWVSVNATIVQDEEGRPRYSASVIRDITARKQTEAALRDSEEQARAFFEVSGVGAARVGPDEFFQKVNRRFCEITGYSQEELLEMTPLDLDHPEEREEDRARIQRVMDDPDFIYDVEKRYVRKSGRVIWVYVNATVVRDREGRFRYSASIVQDITERKQTEEALRRSEQNLRELSHLLEERVAERTSQLRDQAVRLRRLAADLASTEQRERKHLAALLHDDLQQLLVAARMHVYRAGRQVKDEFIRGEIERSAGWIDEAIGAARTLTHQLRPPALYEGSLVDALHGLASEMAERHHLKVYIQGDETIAPVSDDIKGLLFQSVREFLFNIAKHAEVEEALVRVSEHEQWIHLSVVDAGKGFDMSAIEKKRSQSGLGLFSIRERVAAVGGALTITSAPGEGTRISLEVPVLAEVREEPIAVKDEGLSQRKARRKVAGPGDGHPIRVMVVDDHAMVRQGIATLLGEDERLEVVGEAEDGLAAIERFEQQRPDVMLVDLNMPRMNGIEATREIHRRWPETIIIGLSVQDDEATAKAIQEAGAAAFLRKAGDSDRMIATIVELGYQPDRKSVAGDR